LGAERHREDFAPSDRIRLSFGDSFSPLEIRTRQGSRARKRQLLDEISALRQTMVKYRINMESDYLAGRFNQGVWQQKYDTLEDQIATKIEQLSSRAEAITYRNRGNIPRAVTTGGFLWSDLIDTCIYDLDYLKTFIHDYARGRERSRS
jgi:hypothetical protein